MREFLRKAKHVTTAVVALLSIIIVMQNTDTVDTQILFWTLKMPRAALLFGTLLIGVLLGLVTGRRWFSGRKKTVK